LLDQFVNDGNDHDVVKLHALVNFLLFHGCGQHADGAQAFAVLGTHGGLHVFGDFFFEIHACLSTEFDKGPRRAKKTKSLLERPQQADSLHHKDL
jgi:hypothetical protein